MTLTPDPFEPGGIAGFEGRLRSGATTAEASTRSFLERIETLDPILGAYEHVAGESALATARAMDGLLTAGTDLGPLMGVPVAFKDLIAVAGMPTTAGSNVDVSESIGPEGSFVRALRRAGCVILGKLKTVEFARGATGINNIRGTPRNPWDAETPRIPGGSSSGSAVAAAAGLSGFTVGTDTGGSVRGPAAFCGLFGYKPTIGLWSIDGIFPNAPTFDVVGPLCRSAADGALVYSALTGQPRPLPCPLRGLRLGLPTHYFFDNLDPHVTACMETVIATLEDAGVTFVPFHMPEVAERESILKAICAVECIVGVGAERFLREQDAMDPLTVACTAPGLEVPATEYLRVLNRQKDLCRSVSERLKNLDGFISPTTTMVAPTLADITDLTKGLSLEARLGLNTHPISFFGLCSTTSPIQMLGAPLPTALQIACKGGEDAKALSIALAVENLVGKPPRADLKGFLS
jgi:aspartyl-tRNA(Asn)/glutamyl-tRNA(Gln) amidotransferase subunit A